MAIVIKKMETDSEIKGKAYVHWKAWQETYTGLINQAYLNRMNLEKCLEIAYRWKDNILIAKDGDRVVGFVGYGSYRNGTSENTGEVFSIYILKEYYDQKIGYALMCAALDQLFTYRRIALWVLEGNERAIRFYEKCGFRFDGVKDQLMMGTPQTELRMILER